MSIKHHDCFTAHCDECKDSYENGDGIVLHYDSAAEAISEAESCDWISLTDGRLICDRCIGHLEARGEVEEYEDDEKCGKAYRLVTGSAVTR